MPIRDGREARLGPACLTPAELAKASRVGVLQALDAGGLRAQRHWAKEGVQIVTYQNQDQMFADLAAGRLDAARCRKRRLRSGRLSRTKPAGQDLRFRRAGRLSDPATLGEGTGFGLRKGDTALARRRSIAALDALKKDGTLSRAFAEVFQARHHREVRRSRTGANGFAPDPRASCRMRASGPVSDKQSERMDLDVIVLGAGIVGVSVRAASAAARAACGARRPARAGRGNELRQCGADRGVRRSCRMRFRAIWRTVLRFARNRFDRAALRPVARCRRTPAWLARFWWESAPERLHGRRARHAAAHRARSVAEHDAFIDRAGLARTIE